MTVKLLSKESPIMSSFENTGKRKEIETISWNISL